MISAGIDIGGTSVKNGLVETDTGKLIAYRSFPFEKNAGIERIVSKIHHTVETLCTENGYQIENLCGIGISVPGSISPDRKMVLDAFNLNFHNVPIKAKVEEVFPDLPVAIGNDADIAAMAELSSGIFVGMKTAILLTLGTGIGGGIILGGKIFTGGNGNGTEPGHVILDMNGDICTCGNRGCVETLCASTWLIRQGMETCRNNPDSLISKTVDGNPSKVNAKVVVDAAKKNDPDALRIFNQYLENLSTTIASFISFLDPEAIGLGGGVADAGDFLFVPLRQLVKHKNFFRKEYPILHAKYGNTAGMIGAAALVVNQLEQL